MKYRELVEKFIEAQKEHGNITTEMNITVGLLRKFSVFLDECYDNKESLHLNIPCVECGGIEFTKWEECKTDGCGCFRILKEIF